MENLDKPFRWAIGQHQGQKKALWQFYYGTWLAGRGEIDSAISTLASNKMGLAKLMLSGS
jgi:hypothetical protein